MRPARRNGGPIAKRAIFRARGISRSALEYLYYSHGRDRGAEQVGIRKGGAVGVVVISLVILVLLLAGLFEAALHRRSLSSIPIRIHVNGTRGKSSVTRLIAGGLREGGIVTCAKTTGTLARMVLPDASEYPVFRPAGANVIEQVRILSIAAHYAAQAIVVECMALQPHLQWLSESRFLKATHGVITNARADHLDVMGPTEEDVAWALAGTTPIGARLYTGERTHIGVFEKSAHVAVGAALKVLDLKPVIISSASASQWGGKQPGVPVDRHGIGSLQGGDLPFPLRRSLHGRQG